MEGEEILRQINDALSEIKALRKEISRVYQSFNLISSMDKGKISEAEAQVKQLNLKITTIEEKAKTLTSKVREISKVVDIRKK